MDGERPIESLGSTTVGFAEVAFHKLDFIVKPLIATAITKLFFWICSNPVIFICFWGGLVLTALAAEAAVDYNRRYPPFDASGRTGVSGQDQIFKSVVSRSADEADESSNGEDFDDVDEEDWKQNARLSSKSRRRRVRTLPGSSWGTPVAVVADRSSIMSDLLGVSDRSIYEDANEEIEQFDTPSTSASTSTTLIAGLMRSRARSFPSSKRTKTNFTMKSLPLSPEDFQGLS